jgi:hypothetical protein
MTPVSFVFLDRAGKIPATRREHGLRSSGEGQALFSAARPWRLNREKTREHLKRSRKEERGKIKTTTHVEQKNAGLWARHQIERCI